MSLEVINKEGKKVSTVELDSTVFSGKVNKALFYEVIKMQLANRRSGNAHTKTRSDVRGSGAKPYRQKGTGRARAGHKRSPIWRGGGTVFGPNTRDYSYSVPKKVLKSALVAALQHKANEGKLKIVDALNFDTPKTKEANSFFTNAGLTKALLVIESADTNVELSVRNLKFHNVIRAEGLNVFDILKANDLVITKAAWEKVSERIK